MQLDDVPIRLTEDGSPYPHHQHRDAPGFRSERMKADKSGGRLLAPAFGVRPVSPALWLRRTGCRGARLDVSRRRESGASSTRTPNAGATSDPPLRSDRPPSPGFREEPKKTVPVAEATAAVPRIPERRRDFVCRTIGFFFTEPRRSAAGSLEQGASPHGYFCLKLKIRG